LFTSSSIKFHIINLASRFEIVIMAILIAQF
jgi:hypothetical protein